MRWIAPTEKSTAAARVAEVRFAGQRAKLDKTGRSSRRGSRVDEPAAYHAEGVLYLAPEARS
jgi:type I restriction enzyme M protein